jgi:hypothetical protein
MIVDEAEHVPAQSACQRRFAPTAVRLHRNTVRLPAGITFTFTGIPTSMQNLLLALLRTFSPLQLTRCLTPNVKSGFTKKAMKETVEMIGTLAKAAK